MGADARPSLLDPQILANLHNLQVAARAVVEGLHAGAHRSPHRGQSVDFADHRAYVPGDDLRRLDWKVLGRSDRLMLKRYEAETDLGVHLVVDCSGSMAYRGERAAVSKYRYACLLAASLGYLVLQQQDRVGLLLFDDAVVLERRPTRQGQFDRLCHDLEEHGPQGHTDCASAWQRLAGASCHRGLVIVLSDCLDDLDHITGALDRLRHRGHDIALVWVLDPDETDLGLPTVSRLEGLEAEEAVVVEPKALRRAFREEVERHRLRLERECLARRIAFIPCHTGLAPQLPLNQLLVALQRDEGRLVRVAW